MHAEDASDANLSHARLATAETELFRYRRDKQACRGDRRSRLTTPSKNYGTTQLAQAISR
jgi:hypothetical protein